MREKERRKRYLEGDKNEHPKTCILSRSCHVKQETASPLIAGVIVVMADWKNPASATPQNQLQLAECTCRKRCMVGCGVICGVGA